MAEVTLTDSSFEAEVIKDEGVVLVDFWAPWCGPCQMIDPTIDEIAKDFDGKIKVGKLNIDENIETAGKYGIMSIPTVAIFKGGELAETMVGVQTKEDITGKLDQLLR